MTVADDGRSPSDGPLERRASPTPERSMLAARGLEIVRRLEVERASHRWDPVPLAGLPNSAATSITIAADETVWVSCSETLASFSGGQWATRQGLSGTVLRADDQGGVWAAALYTLERFSLDVPAPLVSAMADEKFDALRLVGFRDLAVAPDGSVWVACSANDGRGAVVRFGEDWDVPITSVAGRVIDPVGTIAVSASGVVWAGTPSGVLQIEGTKCRRVDGLPFRGDAGSRVDAIATDKDGAAWTAGPAGVARRLGEHWEAVPPLGLMEGHRQWLRARRLLCDGQGRMWLGHSGGISWFDGREWQRLPSPVADDGQFELFDFDVSPDGVVWAATNGGAARYDDRGWRLWSPADGHPHGRIDGVVVDAHGTALVCTGGRLFKSDTQGWVAAEAGLHTEPRGPVTIEGLHSGAEGTPCVWTDRGTATWDEGEWRWDWYVFDETSQWSEARDFAVGSDGRRWLLFDHALVELSPHGHLVHESIGLGSIRVSPNGAVWVFNPVGDIMRRLPNGQWRLEHLSQLVPQIETTGVTDLVVTSEVAWLATVEGLVAIDGDVARLYGVADGLPHSVRTLALGPDGVLWAVGYSSIAVFQNGAWGVVALADKARVGSFRMVAPGADGSVWAIGAQAIVRRPPLSS